MEESKKEGVTDQADSHLQRRSRLKLRRKKQDYRWVRFTPATDLSSVVDWLAGGRWRWFGGDGKTTNIKRQ